MKLFGGSKGKHRHQPGANAPVPQEEPAPMQEETAFLQEDGLLRNEPQGADAPRQRTPEEQAEIEEMIRRYQEKKWTRRGIVLGIILLLLAVAFIVYKSTVKPPEIAKPTPTAAARTPVPSSQPSPQTTPGDRDPEPTQTPEAAVERTRRENVYSILLLGRDYGFGNTDTIMVMQYDGEAKEINILSIPRDTCANVDSDESLNETKKISGYFARAGVEGMMDAVGDMIGAPLDGYILVSVSGFVQLVDTVGGLDFDVPYYMDYDDPQQNLFIHINKGYQHLDGYNAMCMVRWRQNNDGTNYGDIVRIQNQQAFLTAMAKKCLSFSNLATNLGDYVKIFEQNVKTDLTNGNLLWFAQQFLSLGMENVHFYTLPSNATDSIRGFAYGTILVEEWLELLNAHFNVYNLPLTETDINVISRDENGELYATSGEVKGGMDSFLWMSVYEKRLAEWLESQRKEEQSGQEEQSTEPISEQPPEETETGGEAEGPEEPEVTEPPAETPEPTPEPAPETTPEPEPAAGGEETGESDE